MVVVVAVLVAVGGGGGYDDVDFDGDDGHVVGVGLSKRWHSLRRQLRRPLQRQSYEPLDYHGPQKATSA